MFPLLLHNKTVLAACSMALLLVASFLIPHLSAAAAHHDNSSCYPPDLQALTSFAAAFSPALLYPDDKPPIAMNESWSSEHDCCSWEGVTCAPSLSTSEAHQNQSGSSYARVTALSLVFAQFSASSASSLESLCSLPLLSTLALSFEGDVSSVLLQIPECFGEKLPLLQVLRLNTLNIQGPLPSSFCRLRRLHELDLSSNSALSGPILPLLHLPKLSSLWLSSCSFSGPLQTFHTPLLESLDLSSNSFSGPLPNFHSTPLLHELDLSSNSFSGPLPNFHSTPLLQELYLFNNAFSGPLPTFSSTPLLNVLYLDANGLNSSTLDQSFISLSNLTALTDLHLSSNKFTGPFPTWIGHLSSLVSLDLSFNQFGSPIPSEWQNLHYLTFIGLSGTPLNGTTLPEWLFRLPKLEELHLGSMGLQSEDVLCSTRLSMLNKTLTWLDLSGNNITGSDVLECFALHNFSRSSISLWVDRNPLSVSLSHIRLPPTIQEVSLSACNLTGFLNTQLSTFQSLEYIDLSNNFIAGQLSTLLLQGSNFSKPPFPSLQYLNLSYNKLVGQIPASLPDLLENLHYLYLDHNNLDGLIPETFGKFKNILSIRLSNNHLKATIPPSIITKTLQTLELSYNELEGDLNTLFSSLKSPTILVMLGLAHNHISGSIPPFLGNSTPALSILDLSHNNLSGNIPRGLWLPSFHIMVRNIHVDFISFYGQIQHLVVRGVDMTLEYVWNNFRFLDVSENHLEGVIPSELGDFSALVQLNLSHNNLSGPIPESFGKLSLLEGLDLSSNQLQGSIPPSLSNLTMLSVFNVSYNEALVGPIPQGTQLENSESYIGDSHLCRYQLVLQKPCEVVNSTNSLSNVSVNEKVGTWMDEWIAFPGFCLGIVVGFLGVLWLLHGPRLW